MVLTEKKLRESEERFKALFKGSPIPTYAWQKVGVYFKLIDYNNAADIITHGNVQGYLEIKASEMYRERLDILEDIKRCFDNKTTFVREMKYYFSSLKVEKDLLVKYTFLHPDLILIHTEDITERKKREEKIQYQAKLVEDVSDAIISTDLDFNIVSWNRAAESIFGWKAEEVISKNLRDIIPVEYLYDDEEFVLKEFFEKGFWKGEVIQKHKSGTPINILTSVSLIKDIKGNQVGVVAINRDISERKLVEQKLKESESKFRSIFEAIPDLYFLLSEDTTILDFRGKKQNLYAQPEEFMWKKVVDILPPHIGEHTMNLVKKTIMTKQPQNLEYELLVQNKIHYYEARYFYLSKNRVSCFIRDITERKKIEKEISDLAKFPSENPNPVLRVDKKKILYINQSGRDLFDVIEGSKIPILLEEMIVKAFEDNTMRILEVEIDDALYLFNIAPIQPEEYANIYGQDITERKKSEIALKTEKKFTEDILNSSIDTIFVFDPETGKAYRWNSVFAEVSGYSDEEISKMKAPNSFYNEEDLKRASEASKEVLKEGTTTVEMSLFTKNGKRIPYEYTGTTFKNSDGKILIVSVGRDITEKKLVQQKLKESEFIFRDLYEEAPNAYFSIGKDKSIIRTNKAAKRLLGYIEEEFSRLNVFELYTDTKYGLEKAEKVFRQFKNGETIKDIELQMKHKNGDPVWVSLSVKPIFDSDGRVIESRSMVLDITERKNTEEALKKSEKKYKEAYDKANFYKDLFTHDMNNILQIINSSAEIIGFQLGDSEMSMYIENMTKMIKNQVDRGSKLISNVRTLTELDEQEEISTKQVNISKFLNSSINFVKKAYIGKNISIFAEKLDQKYYTNANELLQDVFDNILINSVKYNENLDVEISIKISKQIMDGKNYFKFELSDNGIGVPDDRKDVIFQPGNRELKGTKGMGIGLSLVKKILEIFEGKIWVEDKIKGDYAKGSNFVVLLPEVN